MKEFAIAHSLLHFSPPLGGGRSGGDGRRRTMSTTLEELQDLLVEQRELLAQMATIRDSGVLYRAVAALDNAISLVHEEQERD